MPSPKDELKKRLIEERTMQLEYTVDREGRIDKLAMTNQLSDFYDQSYEAGQADERKRVEEMVKKHDDEHYTGCTSPPSCCVATVCLDILEKLKDEKCTCIEHNNGGEKVKIVNECPIHDELFGHNAKLELKTLENNEKPIITCICGPLSEEKKKEIDDFYHDNWREVFKCFYDSNKNGGSSRWLTTSDVVANFIEELLEKYKK